MKWQDVLAKIGQEPVFSPGFLVSGTTGLAEVRVQLSRWVKTGKLIQIRKGLYSLAAPFRKVQPEPFLLSNAMKPGSYVSLQSALAHYGMIPEYVPVVTAVTTGRPESVHTPEGQFIFRHVKKSWFFGYQQVELAPQQQAFVAVPEKALLDLVYLTPGSERRTYLDALRLQNLDTLDPGLLQTWERQQGPKLKKATQLILEMIEEDSGEEL